MTLEEFNNYRWSSKTELIYEEKIRKVRSVNFKESLIELRTDEKGHYEEWVRCENVKILDSPPPPPNPPSEDEKSSIG